MVWWEILRGAADSLRAYRLRSFLTLSSVAIGVLAIIIAGTLSNSLNTSVLQELDRMGANTLILSRFPAIALSGKEWQRYMQRPPITYEQGKRLKEELAPVTPYVSVYGEAIAERVYWGGRATDPDVDVQGVDEMYFYVYHMELEQGRPFTEQDIELARPVAILGADVAAELFGNASPLGQWVRIRNQSFEVIGVAKPKGSVLGRSQDNFVMVPITVFRRYFFNPREWWGSMLVFVQARSEATLSATVDEAVGMFRRVRGLKPWEPNDFEVETNESIRAQFAGLTQYVGFFGIGAGAIALVAAGVGIMNIMLVAVRERTREIGIRKAVGARRRWILLQFLVEAVTLGLLGGIAGVVLGVLAGWGLGSLVGMKFVIPWQWVLVSLLFCGATGLIWGTYPAWKAASLHPVEALRYE